MNIPFVARLKNTFAKSRFANPDSAARHVSLIAGGTVIAQAVGILTIPIVSRIYSPADYGIMAVYASVIAILGELSGFRYYLAIPLPKDERYAKALVVLSLGLQIAFVALLAILLFFAGEYLLTKLSIPELIPYRALIPIGLLATGTYLVLTQWAIREKLFSTIARTKITQSFSGTVAKIGLGLLGVRPLGLLIGTIVAQGGGITTLSRSLLKKKGVPKPERGDVRRVMLRYRNFPLFGTWAGLVNTLGWQIVPVLLVVFYNTQVAGLVAMAQGLLQLPAVFIGQAIGQVFLQRASVARYDKNVSNLSLQAYSTLLQIGFLPILIISFFAPAVFSLILGERWIEAGAYARALGPWIAISFAYSPITMLYIILNRQKIFLTLEALHLFLKIIVLYLGYYFDSPLTSIALISAVGLLLSIGRSVELLTSSGISIPMALNMTFKIIFKSLLIASLPAFLYIFDVNFSLVCIGLALSLFVYAKQTYFLIAKGNSF